MMAEIPKGKYLAMTPEGLARLHGASVAMLYMAADLYRERNDARERLEAVIRRIWREGGRAGADGQAREQAALFAMGVVAAITGEDFGMTLDELEAGQP